VRTFTKRISPCATVIGYRPASRLRGSWHASHCAGLVLKTDRRHRSDIVLNGLRAGPIPDELQNNIEDDLRICGDPRWVCEDHVDKPSVRQQAESDIALSGCDEGARVFGQCHAEHSQSEISVSATLFNASTVRGIT
jgi:hypothetical protein